MLARFPLFWSILYSASAASKYTPNDYRVEGLQKFGTINDEIYAGYMPLDLEQNTEGSFFFLLAKQRNLNSLAKSKPERLLIWLNGLLLSHVVPS
jgi:hypothetical protein